MKKLWAIAYKDIRSRFTDRTLLVIMIAAPLAISTIIGLAFGGLGRSSSPIQNIPVAVINNDTTGAYGTSFGAILANLLTQGQLPSGTNQALAACPQGNNTSSISSGATSMALGDLIQGTTFDQGVAQGLVDTNKITAPASILGSSQYLEEAARAAVDKGIYTAAVIIPASLSTSLTSLIDPQQTPEVSTVTVYGNSGRSLSAGIVRSVVDGILSQLTSGNISIGATFRVIAVQQPALLSKASSLDFSKVFACAFAPGNDLIQLANVPVQAAPTNTAGVLLVTFGSAQAIFFALYTGQFGILSMYEERKEGTLQRIIVSPTPRWNILGGKLVGVFVSVTFQLLILIIALTAVASLIEGRPVFIWGNDIPRLIVLLIAIAVATSGFGIFLAGILKSLEQANIVGSVLNIALGVLGGGFGFQLPKSVAQFSFVFWGRDAFDTLAAGRGDISINLLVLFLEGVILFLVGLFLFNRRFEI
jgi:ABC-2 type transport system permease protein